MILSALSIDRSVCSRIKSFDAFDIASIEPMAWASYKPMQQKFLSLLQKAKYFLDVEKIEHSTRRRIIEAELHTMVNNETIKNPKGHYCRDHVLIIDY